MQVRANFVQSVAPRPALYVCSTPIGNLGDASYRLVETLKMADVIAAEDTRHTRKLLSHFDIHPNTLVSCHQHNQEERRSDFISWWQEGKVIALVSDAGTPVLSDPGDSVVAAAIEAGVPVIPVPGPSALLTALVGSGMPLNPFSFFGFLPRDKKALGSVLDVVAAFPGTCVFYEAPHRLVKTLTELEARFPSRKATLAKELTKRYETFLSGGLQELREHVGREGAKGEYVIVLGPPVQDPIGCTADEDRKSADAIALVRRYMDEGMSHAESVKRASQETAIKRRWLYQETLPRDGDGDGDERRD